MSFALSASLLDIYCSIILWLFRRVYVLQLLLYECLFCLVQYPSHYYSWYSISESHIDSTQVLIVYIAYCDCHSYCSIIYYFCMHKFNNTTCILWTFTQENFWSGQSHNSPPFVFNINPISGIIVMSLFPQDYGITWFYRGFIYH